LRIAGVNLSRNERVEIALTRIYGIGKSTSQQILKEAEVDPNKKVKNLNDEEGIKIRNIIEKNYKIEGELRREVSLNIKRLIDIGCYRGMRHKLGLPVRGQRTRTNARTRKGPRRAIALKKRATK
jgi:small subunit ribosomal protein S13